MQDAIAKHARTYGAWRISPQHSNRPAFVFDPSTDGTPLNRHEIGQEMSVMVPDDDFTALIRSGVRAELDAAHSPCCPASRPRDFAVTRP